MEDRTDKVSVIGDYSRDAGYRESCDRYKILKEDEYSDADCEESDEEDFDEDEEWDDSDECEYVDEEDEEDEEDEDPDDYIDDNLYDEPFSGSIRKEVYEYVTYIEQNLDKIENTMNTIRNALGHIKFI